MSNIFDALKKAQSERVENLSGPTRRKSVVESTPGNYALIQHSLDEYRPDLVPAECTKKAVTVIITINLAIDKELNHEGHEEHEEIFK
jgi:hypothetical protein